MSSACAVHALFPAINFIPAAETICHSGFKRQVLSVYQILQRWHLTHLIAQRTAWSICFDIAPLLKLVLPWVPAGNYPKSQHGTSYYELLADNEGTAFRIHPVPDMAQVSVIILHFDNHTENIKYLRVIKLRRAFAGALHSILTWCHPT